MTKIWLTLVLKINPTKVRFFKFTAIFSKENICKNGQKMKNVKISTTKKFREFKRYET